MMKLSQPLQRTMFVVAIAGLLSTWAIGAAPEPAARESAPSRQTLSEPVYRVAKTPEEATAEPVEVEEAMKHPLDPAIELAHQGLDIVRTQVDDYTATLVKRERVDGNLNPAEQMFIKVRNRKVEDGELVTPFSVYLKFLSPAKVAGREVVFVEGENSGKMCAHEGGRLGRFLPTVWLDPNGAFAMRGQKYPLTDIGIENLILKLIERGEQEREHEDVALQFFNNAKINGRESTCIEVKHPVRRDIYDFNVARIFYDNELQLPVRYAAYDWPSTPGGEPQLEEEYTYLDIKVNVGLTDEDFNPRNKAYKFY